MSTLRRIDNTRSAVEEEGGAVERYIERIARLYGSDTPRSRAHENFLHRVAAVLPTLTKSEYRALSRALWTPRLSTLARAVAETRPDLLE